jgi:hypothetical protein
MTLYFFHIRYPDNSAACDTEGLEMDDLDAARAEAVESLRSMVVEGVKSGERVRGLGIEIADEAGTVLASVDSGSFWV